MTSSQNVLNLSLSSRDEQSQESVYSQEQCLGAFYPWYQLAQIKRQPIADFFEINRAHMQYFINAFEAGWKPGAGEGIPDAVLESQTLDEINQRMGDLSIDPPLVHLIPGNKYLVIVHCERSNTSQTFVRTRQANEPEDTVWRPIDAVSKLALEADLRIVKPIEGMLFRTHDELLISWWLGGEMWQDPDSFYRGLGLAANPEQPEIIEDALEESRSDKNGELDTDDNIEAVTALIHSYKATIKNRALNAEELEQIESYALDALYANTLSSKFVSLPWTIADAVWLELAIMFKPASVPSKPPGGAHRKVLIGSSEKLEEAKQLLERFKSLFNTVEGPENVRYMLIDKPPTQMNITYYVVIWKTLKQDFGQSYKDASEYIAKFNASQTQPWSPVTTRPLDLFQRWIRAVWENSLQSVKGHTVDKTKQLFYWAESRDDFELVAGTRVLAPRTTATFRDRFLKSDFGVFLPVVVPVPFSFLYYSTDNVALSILEPKPARRDQLRLLLAKAAEKILESEVNVLKSELERTLWESLAKQGSLHSIPIELNSKRITRSSAEQAQQRVRDLILNKLTQDIAKIPVLSEDQNLLAPFYQRVFYVWMGEKAYRLHEMSLV